MTLPKAFDPATSEADFTKAWEQSGVFAADPARDAERFCIMMPPPNVTGNLHMGHALTFTLQDILVRYNRMKGKDVLWQPGTDHASIAVENIIERKLDAEGKTKSDIGREAFLSRAWEWKEESGGAITEQLRRLGASPDWDRERFTMDDGLSAAVNKLFVKMYSEGLIYKANRLVNWDPKLQTSISDVEVEQREVDGNLWHFDYPLAEDPIIKITVATTRPETMLGDTGVAVHPDDERYKALIGKMVKLPLVGREIPIVADDYADPETGSGAVKITPAHDFNDFEVGRRAGLATINIMTKAGTLNDEVPAAYRGLDRFDARKKVVADIDALGLLNKIEPHRHSVPHGDRGGVPIEPFLTEQWWADAVTLGKPALEAVENGTVKFVPKQWENTYYAWMRNLQPWCVSRQLWWGHQIPAWYGPDGKVFVGHDEAEAKELARQHYGDELELTRDPDVLDTWFSSGLWPFSTLGWPEQTKELETYYPGSVLVTGMDIIFFWVARMMMMGYYTMGTYPFEDIYIHALVRDEHGAKMSKSKGNVIDPLGVIDEYGCDALRFTLAAMAAAGRDIKMSTSRVAGYRNFSTKVWNASKFAEHHEASCAADWDPATAKHPLNKWIIGELALAAGKTDAAMGKYAFNEVADAVYAFTWNSFCDWYLELSKPVLFGDDEDAKAEIRATLAWCLKQILLLLHPTMPFVTDELWRSFVAEANGGSDKFLMQEAWPELDSAALVDVEAKQDMEWVIELVSAIRSARADLNVPPSAQVPLLVMGATAATESRLAAQKLLIARLARAEGFDATDSLPKGAAQVVVGEATYILPLEGVIDLTAEADRLSKEIAKIDKGLAKLNGSLNNPSFVERAPAKVVEEQRIKRDELTEKRATVEKGLEQVRSLAS